MTNPPPRTPAENLAAIAEWLGREAAARGTGNALTHAVIALLIDCLRHLGEVFARLAAGLHNDAPGPRPAPITQRRQTPAAAPAAAKRRMVLKTAAGRGGRRSRHTDLPRHPQTAAPAPMARPPRAKASPPPTKVPRQTHGPPPPGLHRTSALARL